MKLAILVWLIVVFAFFIFPNTAAMAKPLITEMDRWDQIIYKIVQGSVRADRGVRYTKDFCSLLGFKYVKSLDQKGFEEDGYCLVEAADEDLICYSGFQCSTGICKPGKESPWYLQFGPGSCSKYFEESNQIQDKILFGVNLR